MKFYQSYYAYDVNRFGVQNKEELTSYIYALSCHYLKKLGQEVILYVNGLGCEILKPLPYDAKIPLQENVDPKSFWAYGKMLSHVKAPLGAVHIDGDVIISKKEAIDYIEQNGKNVDLFVQHVEAGDLAGQAFYLEDTKMANKLRNELKDICPPEIKFSHNESYHCGLIQMNNQKMKDRYLDIYFRIHEGLGRTDFFDKEDSDCWTPDLVLEQAYLWDIVKYHSYKYACLFHLMTRCADYWCNSIYGYKHFSATGKYKFVERIRAELKAENPKLYHDVVENNIINGEKGLYVVAYKA